MAQRDFESERLVIADELLLPSDDDASDGWQGYLEAVRPVREQLEADCTRHYFWYQHPLKLQRSEARFRKPYAVRVAYAEWGRGYGRPVLLCVGGVANTAMRFSFLAQALCADFHVVCMDWVGRGYSGWLQDERDYVLATYVEQLRQMVAHLGGGPVRLLGSSMGGNAAMALAAADPQAVSHMVLNDIGPFIPKARRQRRSQTLARHYVFRSPQELMRKVGASQKNDGPVGEEERMFITYHQTRWSDADAGRVYRHDVRALQAFRTEAAQSLDQWGDWQNISAPVLVIHGMESDTLQAATLRRMQKQDGVSVMHIPGTGHTPLLSDANQLSFIQDWLLGRGEPQTWSCLHAS